ncbi:hypothetical protein J5N97_008537 [Dioscorea zingiberensis]|uniref:ZFPL1-like U-box domain-containing protein n=1 Tax=Dioscorea zingiberensis TaxID=325984 RepID=A0A9D5HLG9_9LILI|nr:hypothetical protein J5N97_008537 [Dioscorea zingiberensis]
MPQGYQALLLCAQGSCLRRMHMLAEHHICVISCILSAWLELPSIRQHCTLNCHYDFLMLIWPPKSIKDSGSRLHSKLKEALILALSDINFLGCCCLFGQMRCQLYQ